MLQKKRVSVLGYQNTKILWTIAYFLEVGNNEILTIANFLASPFRFVIPSLDCIYLQSIKILNFAFFFLKMEQTLQRIVKKIWV